VNLQSFRGIVFVGGFSYADALGSAKGWAALIKNNKTLNAMFTTFYKRTNSFSLGVCNGCQLMALLGWIPFEGIEAVSQVYMYVCVYVCMYVCVCVRVCMYVCVYAMVFVEKFVYYYRM